MAQGPTTNEQELPAYPIRAYQLIPDPNQPSVVALAIETDQQAAGPGFEQAAGAAAADLRAVHPA